MKKFLFSTSLFLCSSQLFGQITLSSVDFAGAADTVRMSQTTDPAIDFSTTGSNVNWDYSQLTPTAQVLRNFQPMSSAGAFVLFMFGTFAPAKYQATYFTESNDLPLDQITSFLPITIEDIFLYTKKTNDSVTSVGYSMNVTYNGNTLNVPFQSDTIETRYKFPLAFGNTHFSRGASTVDFNPIYNAIWVQHRTRFTEVDGYGSITTPFGTFDALRIRHDIDEIDSLFLELPFIGATWVPLDIPASYEYEWWTNGQKEPLLRIRTSDVFGTETVTAIEYRDIYRPEFAQIEDVESVNVVVAPNPASDVLFLESSHKMNKISLMDAAGRIVYTQICNGLGNLYLPVSDVDRGLYSLIIQTEVGGVIKRIILD
jgi:hypothetical protein